MDDNRPTPGIADTLEPGIRRILAPNPSPMTYWGTNTYLVGEGEVAVLDPGPALPAHGDAILAALAPGERITRILVSHAHVDHSPLALPLSEATGAPVFAFGPPEAGRTPVMARLATEGLAAGGEGVDVHFTPDERLADGDGLDIGGRVLTAIHTPGHMSGHLCFAIEGAVFTADHVMGWASTLISPPDGDVAAFMASCERLAAHPARVYYPGHGAPVPDPAARLAWLIAHRQGREAEILAALDAGPATARALARTIYTDTPPALLAAAERNVFAHLIDLETRARVTAAPRLAADATFSLA